MSSCSAAAPPDHTLPPPAAFAIRARSLPLLSAVRATRAFHGMTKRCGHAARSNIARGHANVVPVVRALVCGLRLMCGREAGLLAA